MLDLKSDGLRLIPSYCFSWSGSVILIFTPIDLIIDRTKKTSSCAEISDKLLKGTLKPQSSSSMSSLSSSLVIRVKLTFYIKAD